jgi:hypothetical protein
MMTKKNKKVKVDEGFTDSIRNDWAQRSSLFRSGQDKAQTAALKQSKQNFVRQLQLALQSAIDSGGVTTKESPSTTTSNPAQPQKPQQQASTPQPQQSYANKNTNYAKPTYSASYTESKDTIGTYLEGFEKFMNGKLMESRILNEASISDFIQRFAMARGSGYDWGTHQQDLKNIADGFQQAYIQAGKFPVAAAEKLFDFVYSVGAQQQRDQYGRITKSDDGKTNTDTSNPEVAAKAVAEYIKQNSLVKLNDPKEVELAIVQLVKLLITEQPTLADSIAAEIDKAAKEKKAELANAAKAKQGQTQPTPQVAESKKLRKKAV